MSRAGGWSLNDLDEYAVAWVRDRFPDPLATAIIDVGAGGGKYRDLLRDYTNIDAVEIWEPYIREERLRDRYRHVYCADVRSFTLDARYSLAIFGDVLEHLTRVDAKIILEHFLDHVDDVLISLPYLNVQGWQQFGDNPAEEHLQIDLTPELILREYPDLRLLIDNHRIGLYVRR